MSYSIDPILHSGLTSLLFILIECPECKLIRIFNAAFDNKSINVKLNELSSFTFIQSF